MPVQLIGPKPFAQAETGQALTGIGTVFPAFGVIYTQAPPVHALQRMGFLDLLNSQRSSAGQPPLTPDEERQVLQESVDLILDRGHILIRPQAERMDLAFAADELLQELFSKRQIEFLWLSNERVREAIKRRGEFWRLNSLPKTLAGKQQAIQNARIAISAGPIYYYSQPTGTRWLTYQSFAELHSLDDASLARHLQEIADYSIRVNRINRPELAFFAADLRRISGRAFAGVVYATLESVELRAKYVELCDHFKSAVHETFRTDSFADIAWINRMMEILFLEGNESQTDNIVGGLSPEFHLGVEWLPGGRFEEGEFLFDPIFDEAGQMDDANLKAFCDDRAKAIIFNFIREFGNLEYVNVGRIPESLALARDKRGRRGVYLAELKAEDQPDPIRRFIRLQKWGVWEHLDEGKDLLRSIEESEDYADYWLDRRLGCRQLGMNLTRRVIMRRLSERYEGSNKEHFGRIIRTTYFERDYLTGIASDKIPGEFYSRPGYAERLAALLGRAAASSLIVGRSFDNGTKPVFDDGDEVVQEVNGLPEKILVGDHSGAFGEYQSPLDHFAYYYARPVQTRSKFLTDAEAFADVYLQAFREKYLHIQGDYRKRRRAFDRLFKHCKYDKKGSFAYRWERVLERLDRTDADSILAAIRPHIRARHGRTADTTTFFLKPATVTA